MDRSIIQNDMALPDNPAAEFRHITLSSLAVLDLIGSPVLPLLLGKGGGDAWKEHVEGIMVMLWVHRKETPWEDVVRLAYSAPGQIAIRAHEWASEVDEAKAGEYLYEFLREAGRISGSLVEPVKKAANDRKNA